MHKLIYLCFILPALLSLRTAAAEESILPEQRIEGYFKAFNSGDADMMRKYLETNFTDGSIEERIHRYDEIRKELGEVQVEDLIIKGHTEAQVIARSSNGPWLVYTFELESQPPHRIVRIGVEAEDQRPVLSAGETRKGSDEEFVGELEKYLSDLTKKDQFSGVVLVSRGPTPLFEKAYGMANLSCKLPNRIDTKFNLGSINKILTQIAIGQLLEQKKLQLDEFVGKHYPDYPNDDVASRVTIRHLVDMSSGMGDIFNERYETTPKDRFRSLKDYLPLFVNEALQFEPGSRKEYSNAGYILLGLLIERISGQDYYEYIQKNIFEPSGMMHSGYFESDAAVDNIAEGYTSQGCDSEGKPCKRGNILMRPVRGSSAGGGYSTAQDLMLFAKALRANKLLPVENPLSVTNIAIAGGAPGINAMLELSDTYTIVVLSNYDPPIAQKVGKQIRAWLPKL